MTDATTDESPHELVLTDRFPVPPAAVWAAWTDPDRFAQWWHAPDWGTRDVELDVRPGGRFAARQVAPDGMEVPFAGFYREVVPQERLVLTLSDAATADEPARTELTVLLRPVEGGTEQEFHQTGVISDEHFGALRAGTMRFFAQLGDVLRAS